MGGARFVRFVLHTAADAGDGDGVCLENLSGGNFNAFCYLGDILNTAGSGRRLAYGGQKLKMSAAPHRDCTHSFKRWID